MIPGSYYHVYNHANGREDLFLIPDNYHFFLRRYRELVEPVARLYAWCLMPNHFHLLVKVRSPEELRRAQEEFRQLTANRQSGVRIIQQGTVSYDEKLLSQFASKCFSNLFNSYTQAFNRQQGRKGSLFMQNMKRLEVRGHESLSRVIRYIHVNPVRHQFVANAESWPYSSFRYLNDLASGQEDKKEIWDFFGGGQGFQTFHQLPETDQDNWFSDEMESL